MTFTPAQIRAARSLLNLKQEEMADILGWTSTTLSLFETGKQVNPTRTSIEKAMNGLALAGIDLLPNDGVARTPKSITSLHGQDGFRRMYDDYYESIRHGGEVRVYNGISAQVIDGLGAEYVQTHIERMTAIKDKIKSRTLVKHGDTVQFGRAYSHYKWLPDEYFKARTMFIYGNKIASVSFETGIEITLIEDEGFSEILGLFFDQFWSVIAEDIPI